MGTTLAPTLEPTTLEPTLEPTTLEPTLEPTTLGPTVDCKDKKSFAWQGNEDQNCTFIADLPKDKQKVTWCNREYKDPVTKVRLKISSYWCPTTCANFEGKEECISTTLEPTTLGPTVDCKDKKSFAWQGNEDQNCTFIA